MRKRFVVLSLTAGIAVVVVILSANLLAGSRQQTEPSQALEGRAARVFALATSAPATYSDPSGALEPMPSTSLNVRIETRGVLIVSFSARGTVAPSGSEVIPIVFIECQVDGQACQPDSNPVEFLYPQFCCDTRSFRWVAQDVSEGTHNVQILWGMGNPTSAIVTNRSLTVETTARRDWRD
jgi:hypothetical protein